MYHYGWAKDYDLATYGGRLSRNGIDRMIEIIMQATEEVVIMCIGPLVNIAEAVRKEPRIVAKSRIVGMLGSLRSGWGPREPAVAEYNIICSTPSAQQVLQSWKGKICLTPLDTCGRVWLSGELYQRWKTEALTGNSKVSMAILQNFELWQQNRKLKPLKGGPVFETCSSTLFDTVAVFLAFSSEHLIMETLNIRIENTGVMKICEQGASEEQGSEVLLATAWTNKAAFEQFLVDRLLLH